MLQGVKSIVRQIVGDYEDSDSSDSFQLDSDNQKDAIWKSDDYISYFRIGFDLSGDYSIDFDELSQVNYQDNSKTGTGLTLGYEYAKPNGFGLGAEFQFYRTFDNDSVSERSFKYNSLYLVWNSTFSNGFSLLSKIGLASMKVDVATSKYSDGLYFGLGLRRPLSKSLHVELGITANFIDEEYSGLQLPGFPPQNILNHKYIHPYLGLSFLF